jgi:hypothetical protein
MVVYAKDWKFEENVRVPDPDIQYVAQVTALVHPSEQSPDGLLLLDLLKGVYSNCCSASAYAATRTGVVGGDRRSRRYIIELSVRVVMACYSNQDASAALAVIKSARAKQGIIKTIADAAADAALLDASAGVIADAGAAAKKMQQLRKETKDANKAHIALVTQAGALQAACNHAGDELARATANKADADEKSAAANLAAAKANAKAKEAADDAAAKTAVQANAALTYQHMAVHAEEAKKKSAEAAVVAETKAGELERAIKVARDIILRAEEEDEEEEEEEEEDLPSLEDEEEAGPRDPRPHAGTY